MDIISIPLFESYKSLKNEIKKCEHWIFYYIKKLFIYGTINDIALLSMIMGL